MDETSSQKEEANEHRKFSQKQYEMLLRCSEKADITEWNEWRNANPSKEILLQGAKLPGAKLQEANVWEANLKGADLREANLKGAHLREAKLQGANLCQANVQRAKLPRANLQGADLREANLKGANLWEAKLQGAKLWGANLQGANLVKANLEGANLVEANLQGAKLGAANLEGANLWRANLQRAHLGAANLKGAKLGGAYLQGATCNLVLVNGSTLLWDCEVDLDTHFRGVGLDSARVKPGLKQLLKYNIRRRNWERWHEEHRFLKWLVRPFWRMSDYGRSTGRIIGVFFGLAVLFGVAYYILDALHLPVVEHLRVGRLVFFRAIYFSIVTMTTLGFGDMHAAENFGGYLLLTLQVLLGYVLLGALVTRFAVLFQAEGPAGKFAKSALTKKRPHVTLKEIVSRFAGRVAARVRSALLRSGTPQTPENRRARNKGKVNGELR